jgi:cell wall-associated NlpC family hydrolase
MQIAEITALLVLWPTALYLTRKSKVFFTLVMVLIVTPAIFFILPARNCDAAPLRRAYVEALCSYEETRYWWGGENHIGIDCSGLVRRALIDALIKQGVLTLDAGSLRNAAQMWWYDASARALRDGYRHQTVNLTSAASINTLDHSLLSPGDIAVTANGVHVLAYVGQSVWIEADPQIGKVVKVAAPSKDNGWLKMPVLILRWKCLL